MTLRNLPEIGTFKLPNMFAFELDSVAADRHNGAFRAAETTDATISILDVIGEDEWTGGGVTSKRISAALRAIGPRDVVVDINSPGGDFFEGVAIYNALRMHPHKVTVRVLGLAASAASVIAMAGDEIQIGKAGFLMIHNAWVLAMGNRHDLVEAAQMMEPFDDAMATVYSDRSGVDKADIAVWMDEEKWFNGEHAVAAGMADGYLPPDAVVEDKTQAEALQSVRAVRQIDARLAKTGMPRTERRALLSEVKGGKHDAAPAVTHDADALAAAISQLQATIRS